MPPFNTPIAATPVSVYTPNTSGKSSVFIQNIGSNTVYLGGSAVSTVGGLPVPAGESVSFAGASQPIYAVAGYNPSAALAGTTSSAAAQGGSVLSVASGGTVFTAGSQIVIEPGSARQEIQTVSASAAGSVTTAAPFAFAHGSASTFNGIGGGPAGATTQLTVSAGAV